MSFNLILSSRTKTDALSSKENNADNLSNLPANSRTAKKKPTCNLPESSEILQTPTLRSYPFARGTHLENRYLDEDVNTQQESEPNLLLLPSSHKHAAGQLRSTGTRNLSNWTNLLESVSTHYGANWIPFILSFRHSQSTVPFQFSHFDALFLSKFRLAVFLPNRSFIVSPILRIEIVGSRSPGFVLSNVIHTFVRVCAETIENHSYVSFKIGYKFST